MKSIMFMLVILTLFISYTFPVFCQTAPLPPANFDEPDAGSSNNPYQIANLANLRWLSETNSVWGTSEQKVYYVQTNDIDATETSSWNGGQGFSPIGRVQYDSATQQYYGNYFYGSYDGQNHFIENIYINVPVEPVKSFGLFGSIYDSELMNINTINIYIDNWIVTAQRTDYGVGGIVGHAEESHIKKCAAEGLVLSYSGIGGVVGIARHSTIETSSFHGTVAGNAWNYFSGIIGSGRFVTLKNCYYIGRPREGIIAYAKAIAGEIWDSEMTFCYAVDSNAPHPWSVGLAHTAFYYIITNCLWDSEVSGLTDAIWQQSAAGNVFENNFGYPTNQMKQAQTYINNGWDMTDIWDIDPDINQGYPFLRQGLPAPENFSSVINNNNVTLSWSTPSGIDENDLIGYTLHRGTTALIATPQNILTFVDSNVPNGQHTYAVIAIYQTGASGAITHTVNIYPLTPPINLTSVINNNIVSLSWTAPEGIIVSEFIGYTLFKDTVQLILTPTNVLSYIDDSATIGLHTYSVYAVYNNGTSIATTHEVNNYELTSPTNLTAEVNDGNVLLSWSAPIGINPTFLQHYTIHKDEVLLNSINNTETSYLDNNVPIGSYVYALCAVYGNGASEPISITVTITTPDDDITNISKTELIGNYPNPFNPDTIIHFAIDKAQYTIIEIYNVKGQKVKTLIKDYLSAGRHYVVWNGFDDMGQKASSGIYFYVLRNTQTIDTKKMILMK